jgi:hypothetical protein
MTLPTKLMIMPQLVECELEILVVGSTDTSSTHLVVVRLANLLLGGPPIPLTSIGDNCLFFGMQNLVVSAKAMPSVTRNSIVLCTPLSTIFCLVIYLATLTIVFCLVTYLPTLGTLCSQ